METLARLESMLGTVSDGVQFLNKTLEGQSRMPIASDDLEPPELIADSQPRIVFSAIKKSGDNFNGDVVFDELPIVTNNCFNKNTGTFVAPRTALFVFSVSALSSTINGTATVISVLKNDNLLMKITDGHDQDNLNNIGFTWIEPMTAGDTLRLSVTGHKLYSDDNDFVFFNGYSLVIFRLVSLCNVLVKLEQFIN